MLLCFQPNLSEIKETYHALTEAPANGAIPSRPCNEISRRHADVWAERLHSKFSKSCQISDSILLALIIPKFKAKPISTNRSNYSQIWQLFGKFAPTTMKNKVAIFYY